MFEAIFAIAQLLPNYRARPIIQQGTGYFFFWTCLVQTIWTLAFAFEKFIISFVAVLCALISMACLLASQHYYRVRGRKSLVEYWLFRFPFYLHCGWLILSSVVQFSILFRYLTSNVGVQLAAGKCCCPLYARHFSSFDSLMPSLLQMSWLLGRCCLPLLTF